MRTSHLSDTEIQLYVAEPEIINDRLAAHMNTCAHCRSRADNYVTLFGSLQHAGQPVFDFDLTELVTAGLQTKKIPYAWVPATAGYLGALLIILVTAILGHRLVQLFTSLPSPLLWLMLLPALVLSVLQALVIANEYQRKMSVLVKS